jgi:hypothetical protein
MEDCSMSLIIFLFWIWVPAAIIAAGIWLWRRAATVVARTAAVIACAAALGWFLWLAVGETWWVDQQVKALCAKDGGVKIYETVRLTQEKYDELKRVNFILPDMSRLKPADEYYHDSEDQWLKETRPGLLRSYSRIIRRSDDKVLGEYVHYGRGAGGLPGPWHGSSFACPDPTKVKFGTAIFVIGDKK